MIIWPLWKRVAFRFVFAYFVLYSFPFPLDYVPVVGDRLWSLWIGLWKPVVAFVAASVFHVPVTLASNGSGDSMWQWVHFATLLTVAAIVAAIWSVLDRRRPNYARLHDYLHVYVRFVLASAMFTYGISKAIPTQMPPPPLDRLVQSYGSSSPMGLLWMFIGASPAYQTFTGLSELLGGVLLVFRRTALLGALVSIAVMTNVVVLNFFYDVPVKLYSSHLLLMALFLAAPNARRLFDFFLRERAEPLFDKRWANLAGVAMRTLLVAYFSYLAVTDSLGYFLETRNLTNRSPQRGIWNVDALDVDGVPRPPLISDGTRWRRVIFDYKGQSSIILMNDQRSRYRTKFDDKKKTITFTNRYDPKDVFALTYARPNATTLQLDGTVGGHKMHAVCKLMDEKSFLLTTRGFHWINEQPFNR